MKVRFADDGDLGAVVRFNERIRAGGRPEQITSHIPLRGEARYRPEDFPVYRRLMIVEDGEEIRAAMLMYHHMFYINGEKRHFCWADMPISEGIVNRKYSLAIVSLVRRAIAYQPFMAAVGIGGIKEDVFTFFTRLGWQHQSVPFFFYPVRVTRMMRGMPYLKTHPKLKYAATLGAYSGLGLGATGALKLQRQLRRTFSGYRATEMAAFGDWSDAIFARSLPDYTATISNDATSLNIMYPPGKPGLRRLRVNDKRSGTDLGWIIVATKQMQDNPYFGDLKVGTLVDGFGPAAVVPDLIAAGIAGLADAGADIIVANFSHQAWATGCRRTGMLSGPSNYQFFVSPGGAPLLGTTAPIQAIHINRGHGDGMVALV